MRKQFVEKFKWIEEEEMLDLIAIAQSTPGAIAVNAAVLIGYRLAGIGGAFVSVLGTVLPPLLILSVISVAYATFKENLIVQVILKAMQAGIAAIILDVVFSMTRDLVRSKKILPQFILIGSFLSVFLFKVNVIFVILVSGLLGLFCLGNQKKGGDPI